MDWLNVPCEYAVIAGGMGNPKECLQNPAKSHQCNVEGPLRIGKWLVERGITPIFFSSDYVFDGIQTSSLSPLNLYGEQKAELEARALQELEGNYLMIRLTKVYGLNKGDGTLFDEMAANLIRKKPVSAAADQVFAPICVDDVIRGVAALQMKKARGLFHFAGPDYASRYEMACYLAEQLKMERTCITKVSLDDLGDGIKRPKCVRLPSAVQALPWKKGINRIVKQYARERDLGSNS